MFEWVASGKLFAAEVVKLAHNVHQVGVYIGSPLGGATCHILDLMAVLSFQVTLRQQDRMHFH